MSEAVSRRGLIGGGLAALASSALGRGPGRQTKRALRVVHLTDVHLTSNGDAVVRFGRCLDQIREKTRPDLILQGGDLVMDGLTRSRNDVAAQYELVNRVIRERISTPIAHCLGNHDVWGWDRPDRQSLQEDALFGKAMWRKYTGYASPYYSFDRGGWHFVVLDSIGERAHRGFTAQIDDAQWKWLQGDLDRTPSTTPICVVSHVPLLAVPGAQFFGPYEGGGRCWTIPGGMAHLDARRIKDLFSRTPNVNLCLSGHVHMASRLDYNGVSHVTSGAVSGAWWKGDMQETKPGYTVIDLFTNGCHRQTYETY